MNALEEQNLMRFWLHLLHSCQFTELILEPWEGARGSADDLECWFYQLLHEPEWSKRQAVG